MADPPTHRVKLVSWNVASWPPTARNAAYTHGSVAAFFAHLQADIVALQEAKIAPVKLTRDLACVGDGWESFWSFSTAKLGYAGVTTYAKTPWSPVAASDTPLPLEDPADHAAPGADFDAAAASYDNEGRAIETDHGSFVLINVYAPNASNPTRAAAKAAFLTALRRRADALLAAGRRVVLCGDFNVVTSDNDTFVGWDAMEYSRAEVVALRKLFAPPLVDAWRFTHPHVRRATAPPGRRGYTCWDQRTAARGRDEGVRIDFFAVSEGLRIVSCDVIPPSSDLKAVWSDHAPLALTIDVPGPPPGDHAPAPGSSACDARWVGDRRQQTLAAAFQRAAAKRKNDDDSVSGAPPAAKPKKPDPKPQPKPPQKGSLDAFFSKKS